MLWQTINQLDEELVRSRRYGVIEMIDGRFQALHFRPWPRMVTVLDVVWTGPRYHRRTPGDRCLVYYHQPRAMPNFLALAYVLSARDCRLATFRGGVAVLDEIARIKQTDAIVCDAWNSRISNRLLARWGWEPHAPSRWHRNYIKRFYGVYASAMPASPSASGSIDLVAAGAGR